MRCLQGHLFVQHNNCASSYNPQLRVTKAPGEQSCGRRSAVCYAAASVRDTLSGLIQHTERRSLTRAKSWPEGVTERGFTFRPAHCVDEDVVLVDLVLVMLEFLLQARQLLVGKLPGAFCLSDRQREVCVRHTQDSRLYSPGDRKLHKYTPCSTAYPAWDHQRCPPPSHRGPSESCFPPIECLFSHPSRTWSGSLHSQTQIIPTVL